ncbi:MAG TPA: low specificity L-threonine aldolase [Beijerinckiaceae bacterium]|nr:low specificity L-threonine aldolase [Beijerinckiaceae bacterium]
MNFASDNVMGASAPVLEALIRANDGAEAAYGADAVTARVEQRFREIFERDVAALLVATGTATNALALAAAVPPWGLCLCHEESHVIDDECGAPEFFSHGAKLAGLPGAGGKLAPATVEAYLAGLPRSVKQMPPSALSIAQVTEGGLVYGLEEIAALARICRARGVKLHMDGARFANALVALGCTPAEMTWKAGVDILSFGATKNGCLAAEAIVVFDPALAESLAYRRKRAGHLLSKGRFIAAQFEGYFGAGHWLDNARHANAMARRLSAELAALPGVRLAWPCEANETFVILPRRLDQALKAAGAVYHPWSDKSLAEGDRLGKDETLVRLVTSFATREAEVDRFVEVARGALREAAA